jgi:DNA-damage-inducible protein D
MTENKIAVFQGKHIRKVLHNDQWWFSIIDVIEALDTVSVKNTIFAYLCL